MNTELKTTAPVAVEEKSARRRGAGLFAGTAVALSLLVGATAALFTDSEWLSTGTDSIGVATDRFNIKIANVTASLGSTGSSLLEEELLATSELFSLTDTARVATTPDGYWESSVDTPLTIPGTTELYPGWSTTVSVLIYNDSSVGSTLTFSLLDATDIQDTSNPILQNLKWSMDIEYAEVDAGAIGEFEEAQSNANTSGNLVLRPGSVTTLNSGDVVVATITITFDKNVNFTTWEEIGTQGTTLNLLLKFTGQEVASS